MLLLTKANIKHHCRTCLKHLRGKFGPADNNTDDANFSEDDDEMPEFKDISIHIPTNSELRRLLLKYVDETLPMDRLEQFPQHMCLGCYNKLQTFEKFRKRALENAQRLHALLSSGDIAITKVESIYGEESISMQQRHEDDIYKLLLKDSLMETESVLLDGTAVETLVNVEIPGPDPFDALPPRILNVNADEDATDPESASRGLTRKRNKSNSSTDTDENVEDREISKYESIPSDDNKAQSDKEQEQDEEYTSRLRSCKRVLGPKSTRAIAQHSTNLNKKRRRTKLEMEELRLKQDEKRESKLKRRNKGTKNNFKCSQCNHSFAHKITLDAHVRKIHEGSKRPYTCDRCDKSYTFIGGLYTHIKEIHESSVRSYPCDFSNCDRVYTSSIAMQKHKRVKHFEMGQQQKKYVCEQCGATFNQTGNLKYHRRTKHPTADEQVEKEKSSERFECDICKKTFQSVYTLRYHTLQIHSTCNEMKFECKICGRYMAKKFMLVQHMAVHSTDRIPCDHCEKSFIRKFELNSHVRAVHMKLKPYDCQYCNESFASRKTLRHHEYIHTGEKPYVCDICGQAYRQQTCLKNHRKGHDKNSASLSVNINRTLLSTFLSAEQTSPSPKLANVNTLNAFN